MMNMKDFSQMSVEELQFAKKCIGQEINHIQNTTENMEIINDLEIQYELVLECLGEL